MDLGENCVDETDYPDSRLYAPNNDKYILSKSDIVDHFEMTLDLDFAQFVQMQETE